MACWACKFRLAANSRGVISSDRFGDSDFAALPSLSACAAMTSGYPSEGAPRRRVRSG